MHIWYESRKVLGIMINKNGIELNLKKLKALTYLSPPKTLKEAQVLTGWIVALSRFISRIVDNYLLFYKSHRNIAL